MEEADALATRAGIMAKKMLALGTIDSLRRKHGDAYYVHLMTSTAPHTSIEEMDRIRRWLLQTFPAAVVEEKTYHGQMRFSVPARNGVGRRDAAVDGGVGVGMVGDRIDPADALMYTSGDSTHDGGGGGGISALFTLLEQHKSELGLEYYSVSRTTLDQVFLSIIQKHDVEEEDSAPKLGWFKRVWRRLRKD